MTPREPGRHQGECTAEVEAEEQRLGERSAHSLPPQEEPVALKHLTSGHGVRIERIVHVRERPVEVQCRPLHDPVGRGDECAYEEGAERESNLSAPREQPRQEADRREPQREIEQVDELTLSAGPLLSRQSLAGPSGGGEQISGNDPTCGPAPGRRQRGPPPQHEWESHHARCR
jgi:hypothetical protein